MDKKNLRILQIEDNPGDARLVVENFNASSDFSKTYSIETVQNLKAANIVLNDGEFDAVLLDLSLPDSAGLTTLEKVRQFNQEVPIIILSGTDNSETAARAVKYGAQDFLVKGHFDSFILTRSVQYAIERKEKEIALQVSEEKLRSAQTIGNLGIWEFNLRKNEISWSDQMYTIFERNPELGPPTMEEEANYYSKDEFKHFWDNCKHVMKGRIAEDFEFSIILSDNGEKHLSADMKPVFDTKNILSGVMCTIKDITHLKNAIQREQERKELLNELLKITTLINQTLEREQVFSEILNGLLHLIHLNFANIMEFQNGTLVEIARRRNPQKKENGIAPYVIPGEKLKPFLEMAGIKQAVNVKDTQIEDSIIQLNFPFDKDIRSMLAVPIGKNGEITGAIVLGHKTPNFFTEKHEEILIPFAIQASIAIQNANAFNSLEENNRKLRILREIDDIIIGKAGLDQTIGNIVEMICEYLNSRALALYARESSNNHFNLVADKGFIKSPPFQKPWTDFADPKNESFESLRICQHHIHSSNDNCENATEGSRENKADYFCQTYPIYSNGETIGIIEVVRDNFVSVQSNWEDSINTITTQLALVLNKNEMIESLRETNLKLLSTYDQTLKGWVETLHFRDTETEEHTQRVTQVALKIAKRLYLEEDEMNAIWRGALLHDIGKIGVPDSILRKPGPLNDEEWQLMKRHPTIAYQILVKIEFLKDAAQIPYCHHEKWDGSGYPRGLSKEEIPLIARIFSVADVWDALTSKRPYRDVWSEEKAVRYIRDQAGKSFDPEVVKVFLNFIKTERENS